MQPSRGPGRRRSGVNSGAGCRSSCAVPGATTRYSARSCAASCHRGTAPSSFHSTNSNGSPALRISRHSSVSATTTSSASTTCRRAWTTAGSRRRSSCRTRTAGVRRGGWQPPDRGAPSSGLLGVLVGGGFRRRRGAPAVPRRVTPLTRCEGVGGHSAAAATPVPGRCRDAHRFRVG